MIRLAHAWSVSSSDGKPSCLCRRQTEPRNTRVMTAKLNDGRAVENGRPFALFWKNEILRIFQRHWIWCSGATHEILCQRAYWTSNSGGHLKLCLHNLLSRNYWFLHVPAISITYQSLFIQVSWLLHSIHLVLPSSPPVLIKTIPANSFSQSSLCAPAAWLWGVLPHPSTPDMAWPVQASETSTLRSENLLELLWRVIQWLVYMSPICVKWHQWKKWSEQVAGGWWRSPESREELLCVGHPCHCDNLLRPDSTARRTCWLIYFGIELYIITGFMCGMLCI